MTTAQTMLKEPRPAAGPDRRRCALFALALLAASLGAAAALAGCARKEPRLLMPTTITAPYDTARGEALIAVVPLRNESGTTAADVLEVTDKVVAAASQVRGLRTLPLNRTLAAMRALNITDLASPADARMLAQQMGVDGLLVGSITAYDPYNPPVMGLALALYIRPGALDHAGPADLDPRRLRYQPTVYQHFPRSRSGEAPASVVSVFLDGKNQQVQADLREYARGRHDPAAALGWRRFLTSMDLYGEFAAWHTVQRLIDHEWVRLSRSAPARASK